jgi:hypothetical protein
MARTPLATAGTVAALVGACGAAPQLGGPLPPVDEPALAPPARFARGAAGQAALRAPGRWLVWGGAFGPDMRPVDALEDYVEVGVGEAHACGRRADGEVRCVEAASVPRGEPPRPMAALPAAHALAVDRTRVCGLDHAGAVTCVDLAAGTPAESGPVGVVAFSLADRALCSVKRSGEVRCRGVADGSTFDDPLPDLAGSRIVRHSGRIVCGLAPGRPLRCVPLPHPTTGYGGVADDTPRPPRVPRVDEPVDLVVTWETVCARARGGDWACDGRTYGLPIDADRLDDLAGVEALVLHDAEIGCGLDADGSLRTQRRARGFCGEDELRVDGTGRDLAAARRPTYSAELGPRFRLGAAFVDPGDGVRSAAGLALPLTFGDPQGWQFGPLADLGTTGFDTFETAGGLTVARRHGLSRVGLEGLTGWTFGPERAFAEGRLRLGLSEVIGEGYCEENCGLRYGAGLDLLLALRKSIDADDATVVLAFAFDPAALVAPFALLFTGGRFH